MEFAIGTFDHKGLETGLYWSLRGPVALSIRQAYQLADDEGVILVRIERDQTSSGYTANWREQLAKPVCLRSWKTAGGKYRIDLSRHGDGTFQAEFFTNGKSQCKWNSIPHRHEAERRILEAIEVERDLNGRRYIDNPDRVILNNTKRLDLRYRVQVLESIISNLGLRHPVSAEEGEQIAERIRERGLDPMLFQHATRIIISRHRQEYGEQGEINEFDEKIKAVSETLTDLGLGGSVTEVITGSQEDNLVACMFRTSDLPMLKALANAVAGVRE